MNKITMQRFVEVLDEATSGKKVLLATGVGTHQSIVARHFTFDYPDRVLLTSCGHGTMGSALPLLMGSALERTDYLPLLVTGDGSFSMEMPGLLTMVEFDLPLKIFVLDNSRLGSFGIVHQYETLQSIPHIATERPTVSWSSLSGVFGFVGQSLSDFPGGLEAAVKATLGSVKAALLHIPVDTVGVWPILESGNLIMTKES